MALTNINDNFQLDAPKHLDNRTGNYASVAAANAAIPEPFRVQGLEVVVITAGQAVKYYYRDGVADEDLVIMPTGGGGGSVAFADITGQPSDNANLDAVLDAKGDMFKSVYDTDNDGIVDKAERIEIIVRNSTGSTLAKGKVVYLSGSTGNRPNAVLADASLEATATKTIGIVTENIANNSDGYVAVNGTLHNLDLSAFTAGDLLWLSETAGDYVANTPPAEPAHAVFIGYVARAHPTQGRIVIAIQNGYELGELHGVEITSPATDHYLYYASDGLWKNRALTKSQVGLANVDNTSDASKTFSASQINSGVFANSRIPRVTFPAVHFSGSALAGNPGNGNEIVIQTLSIPANTLSSGDILRLGYMYSFSSNTGTKQVRIKFGNNTISGNSILTTAAQGASLTMVQGELFMIVTSTTNLRIWGSTNVTGIGTSSSAFTNNTIDLNTATAFSFNVLKSVGADTAILEAAFIEILKP